MFQCKNVHCGHTRLVVLACKNCGWCKTCCTGNEGRLEAKCLSSPSNRPAKPKSKAYEVNQKVLLDRRMAIAISVAFRARVKSAQQSGVMSEMEIFEDSRDDIECHKLEVGNLLSITSDKTERLPADFRPALALIAHEPALARLKTDNEEHILHAAAYDGNLELVKMLIEKYHLDPFDKTRLGSGENCIGLGNVKVKSLISKKQKLTLQMVMVSLLVYCWCFVTLSFHSTVEWKGL